MELIRQSSSESMSIHALWMWAMVIEKQIGKIDARLIVKSVCEIRSHRKKKEMLLCIVVRYYAGLRLYVYSRSLLNYLLNFNICAYVDVVRCDVVTMKMMITLM